MNRRHFLGSAAAAAGMLALPTARASVSADDRKFLLLFNFGGWDTTMALSPMFHAPLIDSEATAAPWTIGDLALVDEPGRPSVRAFFEQYHAQTALVHGILVPSVAHETCTAIAMTGGTRGDPDYPTRIAQVDADRYILPHLVMEAPSFPAELGQLVSRTGVSGQLDALISGDLLPQSNAELPVPGADLQRLVDDFLEQGGSGRSSAVHTAWDSALMSAHDLRAQGDRMKFSGDGSLASRLGVAVDALATGMSRVVSLGYPNLRHGWDSHSNNVGEQTILWEGLFVGLTHLMERLTTTPGSTGGMLIDEVTVVVMSEMGRAPQLNSAAGKDHWPYTSAMFLGGGIRGGTVLGGYDDTLRGVPVEGSVIESHHLGATLFALAGLDPAEVGLPLQPLFS